MQFLQNLVLSLVPMILSLSVHEFCHAFVANKLGDDTAEREGRLTLSPLAHIDPIGTLLLPALGALGGGISFLGWARPVPVNPARFRRDVSMRFGMAITAAAGPLSNLALALLSMGLFVGLHKVGVLTSGSSAISALLLAMFSINVGLCVFNFLPIPPLDGSRLLPRSFDELREKIEPYSMLILLAIINIPALRDPLVSEPMRWLKLGILSLFGLQ